ncbi:RagB/SusD family nutrient uptake outer membrane protein [Mangrovibacterium lignilyticum]|uniref:RagB/SusD family nutrient uptake outer membrane protein n=1 Tax=Mangrovibacterium lignilyticum TaxID=2668052 RepID=UPI0013D86075|nr:RagB/SusD family nutrient uptake outer membrane protein [Mangrovibacterium lignilyticum]
MKRTIKYIVAIVFLFSFSGCEKGLDPTFYGSLNPTVFPSTESEFEAYMLESYIPFTFRWGYEQNGNWYYTFFSPEEGVVPLFDFPTDLLSVFTAWGDGGTYWESKSRGNFIPLTGQSVSTTHFEKVRFVTRITKTIEDLEKTDIIQDEDFRKQLISEAKVARGWTMLFLLQLYGPVPVIVDPEQVGNPDAEGDLTRPDRSDFVSWIVADLEYAAENIAEVAPDYGRFNKGLVRTLLMRLYMNEKDFVKAEEVGREITSMGYSLVDDYASLFREATERNSETIFAISCDPESQGRGTDGNFNSFSWNVYPDGRSWAQIYGASWKFYDSFDPSDKRRELLMGVYTSADGTVYDRTNMIGAVINKFPPEGPNAYQGNDFPVARYADVLLLLAEAISENNNGPTQEAIDLVDMVRERAGIADLTDSDTGSKQAFNDAILRERGWELYFEGQRLPDLRRHEKWPSALDGIPGKNPGPSYFPLPQYAVLEGLVQNEGY